MKILNLNNATLSVDFENGCIASLTIGGQERLVSPSPLFSIRLRSRDGKAVNLSSFDAAVCTVQDDGAIYDGFAAADFSVRVLLKESFGEAEWRIAANSADDRYFIECIDFPVLTLPKVKPKSKSRILFPYNEGALIDDSDLWNNIWLNQGEAQYPSKGCFSVFPNMVCSQMLAYLWEDVGLYIGAHDSKRAPKEIIMRSDADGLTIGFRLFCGIGFGESYLPDLPVVFAVTDGRWESAAERYRKWFERHLPAGLCKTADNLALPEWYSDSPLVVTYPIRGLHDTDEMKPNKMYPYTNALPALDRIKEACHARLLVLLMHWEGTAPWAPPHVWPPFGDAENFDEFMSTLHASGDMLGVYCSGFGYTLQSNLIESYSKAEEYEKGELWRGMCAGPDGKVAISNICTDQRSGYDICPASELGRRLLDDAYAPLFESELDYVQILDQNHGGGQYFCYSREHGHAPAPGAWMTESMQNMLSDWKERANGTLFGCESASSEPFIPSLQFSDNRFELNYFFGRSVPLYSYIYHEYVRNFMGNQVCCPFSDTPDTLRYRLAYSFSIGDSMTLVLTENGEPASYWGMRDFSRLPDREKALALISNLTRFYRESAKPYLYAGRMTASPEIECESQSFEIRDYGRSVTLPALLSSSWEESDGSRVLILVNPDENEAKCTVDGVELSVPPFDAIMMKL